MELPDIRGHTRDGPHMPELSGSKQSGRAFGSELAGRRPSGHNIRVVEMVGENPQIAELGGTSVGDTLPRHEANEALQRPDSGETEGGTKVFTI